MQYTYNSLLRTIQFLPNIFATEAERFYMVSTNVFGPNIDKRQSLAENENYNFYTQQQSICKRIRFKLFSSLAQAIHAT